jgi:ABC-type transport system substrate-binding protein
MDVRVREAMQLAIDYNVLNTRLYDNKPPLTDSAIVPKSSPIYHGVAGPPTDTARARTLVAQTISDGTWDGSFNFIHESVPQSTDQALVLKAMWEAAGMRVNLEVVPSVGTRVIAERKFQVATNGFAVMDPAPWTSVNGLETKNVRQRTGFSDASMDASLKRLRAADSIAETKRALGEMQNAWNKTFPIIVVGHSIWGIALQSNVKGVSYGPDTTAHFDTAYLVK